MLFEFFGVDVVTAVHFLLALLVWTVLRFTVPNTETAYGVFFGMIPTQICLASIWATLSAGSSRKRYVHLVWRLGIAYFLILLFTAFAGPRYTKTLWFTPLMIGPFALTTWVCALVLRWFDWRHVKRFGAVEVEAADFQFRLFDVWRWSTQLCILIAVMLCFREEVQGWDDFGYLIIFSLVAWRCPPMGLMVTVTWWLAMGENWTPTRRVVATIVLIAGIVLSALALTTDPTTYSFYMDWMQIVTALAIVLGTAMALKRFGWRMVRQKNTPMKNMDAFKD